MSCGRGVGEQSRAFYKYNFAILTRITRDILRVKFQNGLQLIFFLDLTV